EPSQITIGAPVLGELDRRAGQLPRILLELCLEPLEQRESVRGGARKAADDVALAQTAHLLGIGLDDGLADADLAVAADGDDPAFADGQDRGRVPGIGLRVLHGMDGRRGRDVCTSREGCKGRGARLLHQGWPTTAMSTIMRGRGGAGFVRLIEGRRLTKGRAMRKASLRRTTK